VRRALHPVERITAFAAGITARDLSQRVHVNAAGEEFEHLGAVIDSLLARLQQSFESQRRLISDAAHELKTPTAVISAEAQELARGRLTEQETKKALSIISAASAGLAREVDDLLELARGDASSRAHESFALGEAIDDAIATASSIAREREIGIARDLDDEVMIDADRVGIIRAIGNLIVNAVRYAPRGTEVLVTLRARDGGVQIDVADRGPGVPPADRRRVFERFVRLAPARREHPEGSGLGLAIVEQVVQAHGGSAEVLEREGGGAVFRLVIPRAVTAGTT
jgi:signal transduction histidine kinase